MRLATYRSESSPRLGVVRGEQIIDVAALEGFADTSDMLSLIDQGDIALSRLRDALSAVSDEQLRQAGALHTLASVHLLAPIPRPRKNIFCLGRNYVDHALESTLTRNDKGEVPEDPIFFTKATTTVNGPFEDVPMDPA